MTLKHLVDARQLDPTIVTELCHRAEFYRGQGPLNELQGKKLGTWFHQRSTRTRWSFESAMLQLGGSVISEPNAEANSSPGKGESLEDSIHMIDDYVDCIVMRHPQWGSAEIAAAESDVPVINAGDGANQHPTQALVDAYTMLLEFGHIGTLHVAIVGDLANGRAPRSLCYLLSQYKVKLTLVSPPDWRMKDDVKEFMRSHHPQVEETTEFKDVVREADVIYMLRNQQEYKTEEGRSDEVPYVIDTGTLSLAKKDARIMHPLPHCKEIQLPRDVEKNDRRIAYERQAKNAPYIRMALLAHLLK